MNCVGAFDYCPHSCLDHTNVTLGDWFTVFEWGVQYKASHLLGNLCWHSPDLCRICCGSETPSNIHQ